METIIGLYKAECIRTTIFHDQPFRTIADVEYSTAGWVDWYHDRGCTVARDTSPRSNTSKFATGPHPRAATRMRAAQNPGAVHVYQQSSAMRICAL